MHVRLRRLLQQYADGADRRTVLAQAETLYGLTTRNDAEGGADEDAFLVQAIAALVVAVCRTELNKEPRENTIEWFTLAIAAAEFSGDRVLTLLAKWYRLVWRLAGEHNAAELDTLVEFVEHDLDWIDAHLVAEEAPFFNALFYSALAELKLRQERNSAALAAVELSVMATGMLGRSDNPWIEIRSIQNINRLRGCILDPPTCADLVRIAPSELLALVPRPAATA